MNKNYFIIVGLAVIMLGALIFAFFNGASPFQARDLKFDQTRESNLSQIKYSIEAYYNRNSKLPDHIAEVKGVGAQSVVDPETGKEYEYSPLVGNRYKLCADFLTNSADKKLPDYADTTFTHPKGHHCFDFSVNSSVLYNQEPTVNPPSQLEMNKSDPNLAANIAPKTSTVSANVIEVSKTNVLADDATFQGRYLIDVKCPVSHDVTNIDCRVAESNRSDVALMGYQKNSWELNQSGAVCEFSGISRPRLSIKATCDKTTFDIPVYEQSRIGANTTVSSNKFEVWQSGTTTKASNGYQAISLNCPDGYKISNRNCASEVGFEKGTVKFVKQENTKTNQNTCYFDTTFPSLKVTIRAICEKL